MPPTEGQDAPPRRVEIVVSGKTVFKAVLVALVVYMAIVAADVLLTIGLSLVFALGLDPIVRKLTARGMGRGRAALLVFAALFVVVSVLIIWVAKPIWDEVRGLANDLPAYVEDVRDG